ncbi:MAG: C39 family peptidase [Chloroflexota bacterium]
MNSLQRSGHPYYSFSDSDINRIPRGNDLPAVQPAPAQPPAQPQSPYASQYEGALVKGSPDPVWLLQGGQRHWVPNPATLNALRRDGHPYYSFSDSDINRIPRGNDVPAAAQPAPPQPSANPQPPTTSQPGTGSQSGSAGGAVQTSAMLSVPYVSQIWPGNTIVEDASGRTIGTAETGLDNCGPASVAMAIQYYRGTGAIDLDGAAEGVRGRPNSNVFRRGSGAANGPTDPFEGADGARTSALLRSFGLRGTQSSSLSDIETQISQGHPVVMLVDPTRYIVNSRPEPSDWFTGGQLHIVVVTGYDASHIFINDPLATNAVANFAVDLGSFMQAARLGMAVVS